GAAAFVEIGKVTDCAPFGTTTEAGTVATEVSPLNSSTVVSPSLGNASSTVPVAVAPSRTWDGSTDRDEMIPAADAPLGRRSRTAVAETAARRTRRRMGTPMGGAASVPGGVGGRASPTRGPPRRKMLLPAEAERQCAFGLTTSPTPAAEERLLGQLARPDVRRQPRADRLARAPCRPGVAERGVAADAVVGGREAGAADQRLVAQERDPGMVPRVAA